MRYIAVILSLYVLILTVIPCVDHHDGCDGAKTEQLSSAGGCHHGDIDQCSPFCTCNCCSSPKIQQEIHIDFTSWQFKLSCPAVYTVLKVTAPVTPIWQPPRIELIG